MGADFSTIFNCELSWKEILCITESLKRKKDVVFDMVTDQWRTSGFRGDINSTSGWVERYSFEPETSPPSEDRNSALCYKTKHSFYLTFLQDSVLIYYGIRWHVFLSSESWQNVLLESCKRFANLFSSTSGVVTFDESPLILDILSGSSYREALDKTVEKEVASLGELYVPKLIDGRWSSGYYTFLP